MGHWPVLFMTRDLRLELMWLLRSSQGSAYADEGLWSYQVFHCL
jgi:hypothetical protein